MRLLSTCMLGFWMALPSGVAAETADKTGGCHYDIRLLDVEAKMLSVRMRCAAGSAAPVLLRTHRTIGDAHVKAIVGEGGTILAAAEIGWRATPANGLLRLRYRFDMAEMTGTTNRTDIARRVGRSVLTSISSFLVLPRGDRPITVRFVAPKGAVARTAFPERDGLHRLQARDMARSGFMVLGAARVFSLDLPGPSALADRSERRARLDVAILDHPLDLPLPRLRQWVDDKAKAVAAYFKGFPAAKSLVVMMPVDGPRWVLRGRVLGGGGGSMLITVGRATPWRRYHDDWKLTHELVHFSHPDIRGRNRWLVEGIAVYIDAIVRIRAGWFPEDQAWRGWMRFLERGRPTLEGGGLKTARGISGVYWGGALFMLLADVEIRKRTQGAKTLGDCLRGVVAAGGDGGQLWSLSRFVAVCDAATGTRVFADLVTRYLDQGAPVDLPALWRTLGVAAKDGKTVYDDSAPLAAFRKVMMRGR